MREAEAVEIAQPCPSKRMFSIRSSARLTRTVSRSPHRGLNPSARALACSSGPKLRGARLWSRMTSRYRSVSSMRLSGDERAGAPDGSGETIDLVEGVVEGEGSAG